jgi:putative glutamine amidotransferase
LRDVLIGITSSRTSKLYGFPTFTLTEAYVDAIMQAGAAPVLIPLGLPEEALERLTARLDGILFSGGGDVHPARYGGEPHPMVDFVDEDRDRVELWLVRHALAQRMPVLGICRGLQVINVAMGGTLYEHIADQHPNPIRHDYFDGLPRDHLAHPVQIEEGSRLAQILEQPMQQVNSLHHQGIRRLANGLHPTAYAPDGLIEGFELPDYPYALAVQWHPEWLQAYEPMRRLFGTFVEASTRN